MTNMTRNISQTVQEREIVKTAPDVVVYIDGLPYLLNPYIYSGNQQYTLVNFNDQVQAFSATYDVDNLKPSASVLLTIPNHLKYLYQAPGGNNLIETMSELQVFAKNYFPASDGNTVYTRVFKGVISHVSHVDSGKSLEIQIQANGILRFFELMQIELNPSLLSNAERTAQVLITNQGNLDPYQILADTFLRGITFEGFQINSLLQQRVANSDFAQSVQAGFCNKWQQILVGIRKDVHIFGYTVGSVLPADINGVSNPDIAKGKMGPDYFAISDNTYGKNLESDPSHDLYTSMIKGYLPDFRIGTISLLNGNIVNRLDRIRTMIQAIGMEGFQDINGEIVVKPPLYNLDVTNVTPLPTQNSMATQASATARSQAAQATNVNQKFSEQHNPFIVRLPEILSEVETEDEQGIRCTRMTIQGDWSTQFHAGEGTGNIRAAASHIDIPKLAMFGLREEPAKSLNWIRDEDKFAMYTYAVSEMNRANRGYRTYQITIPMRPELHLGFPLYFPHKDMYGYIRSVSINYQMGGEASMSILLDTLRKRPLFPTEHTLPNTTDPATGGPKKVIIYTSQPNLVMKWTTPPSASTTGNSNTVQNQTNSSQVNTTSQQGTTQSGVPSKANQTSATGDVPSTDKAVNPLGVAATQLQSPQAPVYSEQLQVTNYRKQQLGTEWGTKADTTTKSFRVQNDKETAALSAISGVKVDQPFFSRERWLTPQPSQISSAQNATGSSTPATTSSETGQTTTPQHFGIDAIYFQRILFEQPFTDEKGYEVVTPFPWGRWKSLLEAYSETRQGQLTDYVNPQDLQTLTQMNAFLFAGMGTPQGSLEPGGALQDALAMLKSQVESKDSFELTPSTAGEPSSESTILSTQQPENTPLADTALTNLTNADLQNKVNLFVQGGPVRSNTTQTLLELAEDEKGNLYNND